MDYSVLNAINNNYQMYFQRASKSLERISSGKNINRASDNPSGLVQSELLSLSIRGNQQAQQNVSSAISLLNFADSVAEKDSGMLARLEELALKASNETLSQEAFDTIRIEVDELIDEFHQVTNKATYGGKGIFDASGGYVISIDDKGSPLHIDFGYLGTDGLGGNDRNGVYKTMDDFRKDGAVGLNTSGDAQDFLLVLQNVSKMVLRERSSIGALTNRLEFKQAYLKDAGLHLEGSLSKMMDVDVAKETLDMTKNQMLMDASMSMMSQGMLNHQQVLRLLK